MGRHEPAVAGSCVSFLFSFFCFGALIGLGASILKTMDPYEVLGIRPKASEQELELAYRSRRAQYHPDKYAQGDDETIRWATARMQAVNAAYAALAGGKRGDHADTGGQASESPKADPTTEAVAERPSLAELLRARLAPYGGFSRIYFAPHIPAKKLEAARGSYGREIRADDVLAMIDITVFGGAKEGALLTEQGMRAKELASSASDTSWSEVREIELRGTAIRFNGHSACDCTMVDKPELVRLVGVLREFLLQLHTSGASTVTADSPQRQAASETPWTDPVLCQQVYSLAKARLIELSEELEPLERAAEAQWLDRPELAQLLESSEDALRDPAKARLAYRYVLTVGLICEASLALLDGSSEAVDPELLRNGLTDPAAIRDLRSVLEGLLRIARQQREQDSAERFFRH